MLILVLSSRSRYVKGVIFLTELFLAVGLISSKVILLRTCLGNDTLRGIIVYVFDGNDVGTYMLIIGSDSTAETVLYYTALLKFLSVFV